MKKVIMSRYAKGTEVIVTPFLTAEVGEIQRAFVRREAHEFGARQPMMSLTVMAETPADALMQVSGKW